MRQRPPAVNLMPPPAVTCALIARHVDYSIFAREWTRPTMGTGTDSFANSVTGRTANTRDR